MVLVEWLEIPPVLFFLITFESFSDCWYLRMSDTWDILLALVAITVDCLDSSYGFCNLENALALLLGSSELIIALFLIIYLITKFKILNFLL